MDELNTRAEAVFFKGGYDRDRFIDLIRHLITLPDDPAVSEQGGERI